MPRRSLRAPIFLAGVLCAVVLLLLGIYLGGHPDNLPGPIRSAFVGDKSTQLVKEAYGIIESDYYRKVPESQLVNQGIGGAVSSLGDQFSHYFDPKTYRTFEQSTNPSFSGIGVTVSQDPKGLRVATVYPNTPASKAGVDPGDVIVAVDGTSLAGRSSDASTALIKGPDGSRVALTVQHGSRRRVISVERAKITQPVVAAEIVRYRGVKYGDVVFTSFTSGSAAQVRAAVDRMLGEGARGIVLDLRGNGGGLLDEAVDTASIFLEDGTVVSTDGRNQPRHVYTATGGAISARIPVVVLVDRNTASSAEIVTGALQDRGRARVVGTHTFGKGVFQEIRQLSNGGALDITVGQFFLPSGRNLGGRGVTQGRNVSEGAGITPNVNVPDNPRTGTDETLQAGLKVLASEQQ